jgi:hypothetical protein
MFSENVWNFERLYSSILKGPFKYYVIMFLTFLGPPTHVFDDVILEWSLSYNIMLKTEQSTKMPVFSSIIMTSDMY